LYSHEHEQEIRDINIDPSNIEELPAQSEGQEPVHQEDQYQTYYAENDHDDRRCRNESE